MNDELKVVAGDWWFVTGKICSFRACSDL